MQTQRFRDWHPIDGIPTRLYLEAMHDDYEGLRLLLRGREPNGPTLRLRFEAVIGYRNVNESYRLKTWAAIPDMKALPTLATVENSHWVEWLVQESEGVLAAQSLVHYAIYTPEDCVDVVAEIPPVVEWLAK